MSAALTRAQADSIPAGWMTRVQWQRAWGKSRWQTKTKINDSVAAGLWEVSKFYTLTDSGARAFLPHYRPIPLHQTVKKIKRVKPSR